MQLPSDENCSNKTTPIAPLLAVYSHLHSLPFCLHTVLEKVENIRNYSADVIRFRPAVKPQISDARVKLRLLLLLTLHKINHASDAQSVEED
eukprot:3879781-Pyramimonas_sp.AAC.1